MLRLLLCLGTVWEPGLVAFIVALNAVGWVLGATAGWLIRIVRARG